MGGVADKIEKEWMETRYTNLHFFLFFNFFKLSEKFAEKQKNKIFSWKPDNFNKSIKILFKQISL